MVIMLKNIVLFSLSLLFFVGTASAIGVEWRSNFSGVPSSIQQTSGGGFVIAGSESDKFDVAWLTKVDSHGDVVWSKSFNYSDPGDRSSNDVFKAVIQASDDGYLAVGYSGVNGLVVKVDSGGEEEWHKLVSSLHPLELHQASDGGYFAVGYTKVVKLSSSGEVVWSDEGFNEHFVTAYSVQPAPDGGCVVAGYGVQDLEGYESAKQVESRMGYYDAYLLKFDSEGREVWNKSFGNLELLRIFIPWGGLQAVI